MYAYLRCNSNKFLNSISLHIFELKNSNNMSKIVTISKKKKKIKEYNPLYVHFTDIMLTKKSFSWHNNNNIFASDYIICKHKF